MAEPELTAEQQAELQEKLKNMSPEELAELQKQQCIFCQIIAGKIPSHKVYDDKEVIAILDIHPATKGQVIVMSKEHYAIMPQIPPTIILKLSNVVKRVSHVLLRALKVEGTSVFIANGDAAGQTTPHFMIHVIPRSHGDGILEQTPKIIEKELITKTKEALQDKLNQILEVTEEVQQTLSTPKETPVKEEVEEPEEEPEAKEKPKPKKKKTAKKKAAAKKKEEPEEQSTPAPAQGGASLDDIANLFK